MSLINAFAMNGINIEHLVLQLLIEIQLNFDEQLNIYLINTNIQISRYNVYHTIHTILPLIDFVC